MGSIIYPQGILWNLPRGRFMGPPRIYPGIKSIYAHALCNNQCIYIVYGRVWGGISTVNLVKYKRYRNKLTGILRCEERRHYNNVLLNHKNDTKGTWKILKNSIRDARTPQPGKIVFNTMSYRSSETVHRLGYF